MNPPLYVFDLDGTVSLPTPARRALLEDKHDTRRWRKFYEACITDLPNKPVIATLHALRSAGADIMIWSGRSDEVSVQTHDWLWRHSVCGMLDLRDSPPRMRNERDYTPDDALKESWLRSLNAEDRARLVATFDDRDKVVAMWRRNGITCFQVAPGDF